MAKKTARRAAKKAAPPSREIRLVTTAIDVHDQIHLIAVCDDGTVWGKLIDDTAWKRDPAHETFDESSADASQD